MGPNTLLFAAIGAALGAAALVVGVYLFINRRRLESERLLQERVESLAQSGIRAGPSVTILREELESKSFIDKLLAGKGVATTIEDETRRSGLGWSAGHFLGYVALGGTAGIFASFVVSAMLAFLIGMMGAFGPFVMVSSRKKARIKKLEEQLPDAIDMLVNSLRAGYSLQAGMSFVGSEMPEPLGPEFSRFYDEQRLGLDVRQALSNMSVRLGTLDARMFVLAVLIQRETGGNLSEILGNIATVVRERINFRGQLDVLTSESKMSAVVLTALPILLFFVIRVANPSYVATLTDTDAGKLMLIYAAVSLTIGFFMLRSMATIEV